MEQELEPLYLDFDQRRKADEAAPRMRRMRLI
jgi:hypothetical protein